MTGLMEEEFKKKKVAAVKCSSVITMIEITGGGDLEVRTPCVMRTIIKGEFWRDCRLCEDGNLIGLAFEETQAYILKSVAGGVQWVRVHTPRRGSRVNLFFPDLSDFFFFWGGGGG